MHRRMCKRREAKIPVMGVPRISELFRSIGTTYPILLITLYRLLILSDSKILFRHTPTAELDMKFYKQ